LREAITVVPRVVSFIPRCNAGLRQHVSFGVVGVCVRAVALQAVLVVLRAVAQRAARSGDGGAGPVAVVVVGISFVMARPRTGRGGERAIVVKGICGVS